MKFLRQIRARFEQIGVLRSLIRIQIRHLTKLGQFKSCPSNQNQSQPLGKVKIHEIFKYSCESDLWPRDRQVQLSRSQKAGNSCFTTVFKNLLILVKNSSLCIFKLRLCQTNMANFVCSPSETPDCFTQYTMRFSRKNFNPR